MIDYAWDKERERLPVDTYGYRLRVGATMDDQRWEAERNARHVGGKPRFQECGCCGAYHQMIGGIPYSGDCRNDLYRIADPDELHGPDGWEEEEA